MYERFKVRLEQIRSFFRVKEHDGPNSRPHRSVFVGDGGSQYMGIKLSTGRDIYDTKKTKIKSREKFYPLEELIELRKK
ncbi:MAG: hypothetical protein KatS3mg089_0529 [Patescibacteria group bacterium]|nr:MAG: hypothetical protein KatS3mg089_0529 [Patescibacteria group bacterium]